MYDEITSIFKQKKIKATPQRIAVYDILKNTTSHPTVEEIYNQLQVLYPSISLATVYKTLESFRQVGLVLELNTSDHKAHYDACTIAHTHTYCLDCGVVRDLNPEPIGSILQNLPKDLDFDVMEQQVYLLGICKECKLNSLPN